ncbi:DoxX family protein [Winogradskyella helgolandensis]|uniref:DoxX family protein n=1 Tax=Winogradskyella helgolandensis TaxID=2697010 RepID=UPI0015CEEAEC|nr:DoxX family protein [Winogradskyella helgolandensis]
MKKTKILQTASNIVAAALMVFFAIPKLLGAEKSVQGFEQFKSLVPLDPNVFRVFTGIVELFIAILILLFIIKKNINLGKIAYFLLLATMIGGLIMEFFARPKPAMMLVIIALLLSILSIFKLKTLSTKQQSN